MTDAPGQQDRDEQVAEDTGAVADDHVADGRTAGTSDPAPRQRVRPEEVDTGLTTGMVIATSWAWRLLVVAAALAVLGYVLAYLSEVVIPLVVAVLLTALLTPAARWLRRVGVPAGGAAAISLLTTIVVVAGLLFLVGATLQASFGELASQVSNGVQELRDMARVNWNITDQDIEGWWQSAQQWLTSGTGIGARAAEVGTTATHAVAGLFIALFATFFFLYDGAAIWAWLVRLLPGAARPRVDSSARRAWVTLTAYVRATILVAATDAVGITIGALALQLPAWQAIGALVFVGAFVPIVGALVSGFVAVIIAFVAKGWVAAVVMLGVVIAVQQLESHVLQPFLLGRAVKVHPLAVILAIAAGIVVAGIVGALVAVPLAAMGNTVVKHLAGRDDDATDPARAGLDPG